MAAKPILYGYWISSCSWRVRAALAFKGIEYESKYVNLLDKEQNNEDFKSLNKLTQVPVLVTEGQVMTQSISILEYLEERYPQKPLMPTDLLARAKIREICEVIGSAIQPMQNLSSTGKLDKHVDNLEWAHYYNKIGLQALEKLLEKSSGKYSVGDQFTLADCCLVPQVFAATIRFNVTLEDFPTVAKIYEHLNFHPAIKASHPSVQPDVP